MGCENNKWVEIIWESRESVNYLGKEDYYLGKEDYYLGKEDYCLDKLDNISVLFLMMRLHFSGGYKTATFKEY